VVAHFELKLRHMPIGLSVADETDVVRFWAGAGFETCHPKFIGRDLRDCHPKAVALAEACGPGGGGPGVDEQGLARQVQSPCMAWIEVSSGDMPLTCAGAAPLPNGRLDPSCGGAGKVRESAL
jgi:hypothetical protein